MTRTRLRAEEVQDGECKLPGLYEARSVTCTHTEPPGQSAVREDWGLNLGKLGPKAWINSLTSSPHTTAQTCGASGGDRGVQDLPGFPLLNPLASPCGRLWLPHLRSPGFPLLNPPASPCGRLWLPHLRSPGFPLLNPLASPCGRLRLPHLRSPGFPLLNPLASPCGRLRLPHLRAPQAPFRPRPAGRGTAKGWSPRAEEVRRTGPRL
nr:uncharacterized protein LOC110135516 [Odocoileus virginianus texanus]